MIDFILKDRKSAIFRQKLIGMMLEVRLDDIKKVLWMLNALNKYVANKDLDRPPGKHFYLDYEWLGIISCSQPSVN